MESLKYSDEEDRTYGLTGMSIAAVVWDELEAIKSVNLDAHDSESLEFESAYMYGAPAGASVRGVWEQNFLHFRLYTRLMLANVACRALVARRRAISPEIVRLMRSMAEDEGRESCQLETDESDMVFDKNYDSVIRIFRHDGVQQVAHAFAEVLKSRRSLSAADILEQLADLRML